MITDPESCRHNTRIDNLYIFGRPNSINGFMPSKKGGTNLPASEITHHFTHVQSIFVHQRLAKLLPVNV
jgi:hypothetical protein